MEEPSEREREREMYNWFDKSELVWFDQIDGIFDVAARTGVHTPYAAQIDICEIWAAR